MADSRRPGLQLYTQLFPEEENAKDSVLQPLHAYLKNGGSIFPLVEKGVEHLASQYQMNREDARRFLRRANSMATYLSRQFIEQQLSGGDGVPEPADGLLSWVTGPRYELLFNTEFDRMALPESLESMASPVAYLIFLLLWIRDRIESVKLDPPGFPLEERRADLMDLSVDFNAVFRPVSSVDIIVSVLERFIAEHSTETDPPETIEDAMIEARYPNGLPYFQHWVTVDGVAQLNNLSVGDFAHAVHLDYPYFLQSGTWIGFAERALAHSSRFGPYQRNVLTEPPVPFADRNAFYRDNYGSDIEHDAGPQNLSQVPYFGEHTKLDTLAIERLLSIRDFAPVRSANVIWPEDPVESGRSGSVYINANAYPGVNINIADESPASLHRLSVVHDNDEGLAAFDRMNRMIRLCNWLELPSDQVDALLAAAIRAEVRGGADETKWWITDNVVHAIGLFQTLRERYNCTAADFAVFIDQLAICGRGEALSQFDQVFNSQGRYREPLVLDDGEFPVTPAPGQVHLTISQLCSGLGIDTQTYQYLALQVAKAHGINNNTFKRNLPIISSFYRLVRLSRLLGMTPVEGVLMLLLMGGETWLNELAGTPKIGSSASETPDVLNIIDALQSCVQWCEQNNLPVLWMLQHAATAQPAREATEQDQQLFDQIRNLLPTVLFSNAAVLMAGLPPAGAASWLDFLVATEDGPAPVVDADGLLLAPIGTPEQYLIEMQRKVEWAVDQALGTLEPGVRTNLANTLLNVLLEARDAQASLVKETLAVYAGIEPDQAIPVLNWADKTVYQFLRQVKSRIDSNTEPSRRNPDADLLLTLLAEVRRRSEVVSTLGLSATLLQDYLDYGYRAWMGQTDKYALTVTRLYHLTTLTRAFGLSTQPAQQLLDYLREVNALKEALGVEARQLAHQASTLRLAEFFDWSVQEVRECVNRLDPNRLILRNLSQLAVLIRVHEMSRKTGMDALTIFLMGHLPEAVDKGAYAEAAELALLSQSEARTPLAQVPGDLRQLVIMTCVVQPTQVVARSTETATYTVTLRDPEGEPLSGIGVHFRASLGDIEETGDTDHNGQFVATYTPGDKMGEDTPVFWLDLFEPENAPTIELIPDKDSLDFVTMLKSPVPSGPVPSGQEVELYATLMDRFGNLGVGELVDWFVESGEGETTRVDFRGRHGKTNQEGLTRVYVSSATGGTFRLSVLCHASELKGHFEAITFEGSGSPA
ncbi:Ig-like domain-containing protein [Pseudomonas sp. P155]|uniref:Ig-like domain-containing protein n=1 Tax=Pseudomonas neuropathica TaxID=2730425 RepID=A0ABS0BH46_9PSED|nr:Tc toxin subunit A [Pseudomonas neuropathica]MBF6032575.1 Ig-like domain-containing protein [Pseudomonas neuropathica]